MFKSPAAEGETIEVAVRPTGSPANARRPYRTPRLEHLGDVRDLTLGGTGTNVDSAPAGTFFTP